MIENTHPILQTLLGTLFTWGMTAVGASLVLVFTGTQRKVLDGSLGFAAGVMLAASYWSLLAPAIEMAETSGVYGDKGQWAFVPVSIGFVLGALFVYGADFCLPHSNDLLLEDESFSGVINEPSQLPDTQNSFTLNLADESFHPSTSALATSRASVDSARQRRKPGQATLDGSSGSNIYMAQSGPGRQEHDSRPVNWRRILLLIIAITVHNIPEGLAVGVGFGAVGKSRTATFEGARNLAFGIGIQNFPEGLAVSLPLRGAGMSVWKSLWYGQLSGLVEPVAALLGVLAVSICEPILPYSLAFAAGAMIYVVVDDIIPEAQMGGNRKLASWGAVLGFVVMMMLDVGLG